RDRSAGTEMSITQYDDPSYLESVYAALLAQLETASFAGNVTLETVRRTFDVPDEIPAADQPALVLVEGGLLAEQKTAFALTKWTFSALALFYLRADPAAKQGAGTLPVTQANYLIWGIKGSFDTKPPYGRQTLGGLVQHAWIEGMIIPEVQAEQILISIPIYMLAGPSE